MVVTFGHHKGKYNSMLIDVCFKIVDPTINTTIFRVKKLIHCFETLAEVIDSFLRLRVTNVKVIIPYNFANI